MSVTRQGLAPAGKGGGGALGGFLGEALQHNGLPGQVAVGGVLGQREPLAAGSFGDDVEVLAPASLRARLQRAAGQYEPGNQNL